MLAVTAAVVAGKNLWIGLAPRWPDMGLDGSAGSVTHLIIRNTVLAAAVVFVAWCWSRRDPMSSLSQMCLGNWSSGSSAAVWWRFGPLSVALVAVAVASVGRPVGFPGVRLLGVVFGTALLEEVIFRGALLGMSSRASARAVQLAVPGVAFGCWHVIDAVNDVREHPAWSPAAGSAWIVGTIAAMTLVSWCVFEPIRHRDGTIVGVWLLHAVVNGGMIVLGFSEV